MEVFYDQFFDAVRIKRVHYNNRYKSQTYWHKQPFKAFIRAASFSFHVFKVLVVNHVEFLIETIQEIGKETIWIKWFVFFIIINPFNLLPAEEVIWFRLYLNISNFWLLQFFNVFISC